jgi:hypothetical protein
LSAPFIHGEHLSVPPITKKCNTTDISVNDHIFAAINCAKATHYSFKTMKLLVISANRCAKNNH